MTPKLFSILLIISLTHILSPTHCYGNSLETLWSGERAEELIHKINTTQDVDAFREFAKAYNRNVIKSEQVDQLIIPSIPQEILEKQDDITATWLFLSILNNKDQEAVSDLKKLSKTNSFALNHFGYCYEELFKQTDINIAHDYYYQAAEQNNPFALLNLGRHYYYGKTGERNIEKAIMWFEKAAELGDARSQTYLGWIYLNGEGVKKDIQEAVTWYIKAASQGYAKAQYTLGWCYQQGEGIEKDSQEAINWYIKAANQGNVDAQFRLGKIYYNGKDVEKDFAKAIKWFRLAAKQGDACAQYYLGLCYHNGFGIKQDDHKAAKWHRRAAIQGHVDAHHCLGWFFYHGRGVEQDFTKAIEYFRYAAKHGHRNAQNNLGWCYQHGKGVEKNNGMAASYFLKAALQGKNKAKRNLKTMIAINKKAKTINDLPITQSIQFLKDYLQRIRYDTVYWIGLSGNDFFHDTFGLMPLLGEKAEKIDALYRKMEKLFPLLENPHFCLTCVRRVNEEFQQLDNTLSLVDDYDHFCQLYAQTHRDVFECMLQLQEWSKKIHLILNTQTIMQSKDVLKVVLKEIGKTNEEEERFISPFFKRYLEAATVPEEREKLYFLSVFLEKFDLNLQRQVTFFTDLGSLFDLKIFSSDQDFLQVFDRLAQETIPYRNYLFLAKYEEAVFKNSFWHCAKEKISKLFRF